MKSISTYDRIVKIREDRGAGYFILLDPDKNNRQAIPAFIRDATEAGVDGFLVGGSLMLNNDFEEHLHTIKQNTSLPVIIFPGGVMQVSAIADAILFLTLISGRNPDYLIGNQVLAAPIIRQSGLEAISTAYMLIEAGNTTSAEFMSNTKPIPRDKADIALAHALAAEILGMKLIYLDAGSGARESVPEEMIQLISRKCALPVIVGGGIRTPDEARKKVEAGASFVVTGTITELSNHRSFIKEFADAVHARSAVHRKS